MFIIIDCYDNSVLFGRNEVFNSEQSAENALRHHLSANFPEAGLEEGESLKYYVAQVNRTLHIEGPFLIWREEK